MISQRKLDFFATLVVLQTFTITKGFVLVPNPLLSLQQQQQQQRNQYYNPNINNHISLFLASKTPDLNSQDPFIVLGLDPTVDKKEIKRAYKKMALKYHPDMTTTKDSTEVQKKRASAQFAKINWAYQTLMGKEQGTTTTTSSTSSSTTSSSSGWTPPHRRSGPTASSSTDSKSTYSSTDWRDYIPNYNKYYNDDEYDTGGDSLGAIFADLFQAATSKSGSAGVFRDFVEFLEQTVEGYTSGSSSAGTDIDTLNVLLQTGSLREIGEEMDETDLIVQQLNTKLQKVENELYMLKADLKLAVKFSEKLELEESIAELEARKDVVEGYLKKANKRLLKLQSRYKELIVNGDNDIGTSTTRARDDFYGTSSSTSSSSSSRGPSGSTTAGSSPSSTSSSASKGENDDEEAWKHDGFGSYGRRGSSRRRSRQSTTSTTSNAADSTRSSSSGSYSYARSEPSSSSSSSSSAQRSQPSSTNNNNNNSRSQTPAVEPYLPPHRRTTSTGWSRQEEDRRRLSELKVDEEFDRLKKELGL